MKSNMLLFIVLGQIATSALVSGDCELESRRVMDFDWNKVGLWNDTKKTNQPFRRVHVIAKCVYLLHIWISAPKKLDVTSNIAL